VALFEDGGTITFSPIIDGKPFTDAEFSKVADLERQHYFQLIDDLEDKLSEALVKLPKWKRATAEKLRLLKNKRQNMGSGSC
jgi:hypothetical protein